MTGADALVQLQAVQSFLRLPLAPDGKVYGPGFFHTRDWVKSLESENRRVTLRVGSRRSCAVCGGGLSGSSTGDHLIPLAKGGPVGAQNFLPLCRSCNASKGPRDFLEWLSGRSFDIRLLDLDAVCAYARLKYAWLKEGGHLGTPASRGLQETLASLRSRLPERHRAVLDGLRYNGAHRKPDQEQGAQP
jgi:hypothetical protein